MRGLGGGAYEKAEAFYGGAEITDAIVVDLAGNGKLSIAVANGATGSITLLRPQ
jgi:hypothetical protein